MCPDKNILSAYFDGELDERFCRDIEAHVHECDSCTTYLEELEEMSVTLKVDDPALVPANMDVSWNRLVKRVTYAVPTPVWRRRVQLPAPVLAAVALVVIFLSVGLFLSMNSQRTYNPFDNVTRAEIEGSELTSVESILRYLDNRGDGFSSTFNLPQDTKLQFWSEPTLIRAADYRRGRD